MAVTSTTNTYTNTANGSSLSFTFPFYILDGSHIAVTLTALDGSLTTGSYLSGSSFPGGSSSNSYIVTGIGLSGFTVTFPDASLLASGVKVTADRATPLTQPTSWTAYDTFPSAVLEKALDRLTMEMQTIRLAVSRCLSSSNPNVTFALPTPTALGFFQWNSAGTAVQYRTISQIGLGFLASTASAASIRVPHGVGPTAPVDGDIWSTTAGLFARINGSTVGPFIPSSSAPVQSVAGRSGAVTLTAADIGTGTFGGKMSAQASAVGAAGFSLLPGVGPTAPVDGDLWLTTSGVFARVNGATVSLGITGGGSGTVTSVAFSGGTTGLTVSGSPVTSSGTITLGGTLAVSNGGTGLTALGTGIPTWLGTPSSANLLAALQDKTGTGLAVFSNNPTLAGATLSGTLTTKSISETRTNNATASGALTIDLSIGTVWTWTLTGNVTGITITNPTNCTAFSLRIAQDGTGGRTVTWSFSGATIRWPNGIAPTQTSTLSKADWYHFISPDGGTSFDAVQGSQNF